MKKIVITYPYFLPAYKAGGPIQSIANLCRHLYKDYHFFIICGDTDLNEKESLSSIQSNTWNDFENGKAKVYYISRSSLNRKTIFLLLHQIKPDYIFINGIFSPLFSFVPLWYSGGKKVVSVRGMLHPGALSQKRFKKNIFIRLLKLLQVQSKVLFHATDEKEKEYITSVFGSGAKVLIAQNLPSTKMSVKDISKNSGELNLVSIALISPMKNHALVLEALKDVKPKVNYDIYGPVKDEAYWQNCLKIADALPQHITVTYKGSIAPESVAHMLPRYHCFILPSKSENFGHAIYEALSSGLPVITSYFTPWNGLQEHEAGWNVDISNIKSITAAIEKAAVLDHKEFMCHSKNAVAFAEKSVDIEQVKKQYQLLFQ